MSVTYSSEIDNSMVCPKDSSIRCLECPFERCYMDEADEKKRTYDPEYYQRHKESYINSTMRWREKNPDRVKQYHQTYYQNHKDKVSAKSRRHYQAHREEILAKAKAKREAAKNEACKKDEK